MDLAESDPAAFGVSISFEFDYPAIVAFSLAHGAVWAEDENGKYLDFTDFHSPDPDNTQNLPHVRLAELRACDVVDEPAANPAGLFHREQQFAQEAESLVAYAIGLTADRPQLANFAAVHPDRVKGFVAKFLDSHNLQLIPKEPTMPGTTAASTVADQSTPPAPDPAPAADSPATPHVAKEAEAAPAAAESVPAAPAEASPAEPDKKPDEPVAPAAPVADPAPAAPVAPTATAEQSAASGPEQCKKFIAAFGVANGAAWFAEGLSFADAQAKHLAAVTAENASLKSKLTAVGQNLGEAAPVSPGLDATGDKGRSVAKFAGKLPPGLAAFAAGMKLPEAVSETSK
jgi:hypothetical protein